MPTVQIPMAQITDWSSFHDTFSQALGFPDFTGGI
jgi:RNAse (barnase) inhibitor barstar